jgi:3-hydroxybutyryl-CoA dehydrogenase
MASSSGIRIIGVIGAGQMGAGIAQVAAAGKLRVILADVDNSALGRGLKSISSSLSRFVTKGSLSQVHFLHLHFHITVSHLWASAGWH